MSAVGIYKIQKWKEIVGKMGNTRQLAEVCSKVWHFTRLSYNQKDLV